MEQFYQNISSYIVVQLDKLYPRTELEKIKMRYGIEVLLDNIIKIFGYLIIAAIIGCLRETIVMITIFGVLRINAGGMHLSGSLSCFLTTGFIMVGGAELAKHFQIDVLSFVITMCILIFLVYCYAPSGTSNNPINPAYFKILKYRSVANIIMYGIIGINVRSITMTLILIGSCCEIITILPFANRKYKAVGSET